MLSITCPFCGILLKQPKWAKKISIKMGLVKCLYVHSVEYDVAHLKKKRKKEAAHLECGMMSRNIFK